MPVPLSLSDDEYAAVMKVAGPIHPLQRDAFLKALAEEPERHPSLARGIPPFAARTVSGHMVPTSTDPSRVPPELPKHLALGFVWWSGWRLSTNHVEGGSHAQTPSGGGQGYVGGESPNPIGTWKYDWSLHHRRACVRR